MDTPRLRTPIGRASLLAALVASTACFADATAPGSGHQPKVVLELFTSQGCSSCPPADRILEKLAARPDVVALSRPVQYWDRLGWKDTLATSANTEKQYTYAEHWRKLGVYTPQLVIDGSEDVVGNQDATIRRRIDARSAHKSGVVVRSIARADGTIAVTLTGAAREPADVHLLWLRASTLVSIRGGENSNRRVRYTNAVMKDKTIGKWRGDPVTFTLDPADLHTLRADRWAIVIQQARAGAILGGDYLAAAGSGDVNSNN